MIDAPKIIIIDEDESFSMLLKEGLTDIGYDVRIASTEQEGLRYVQQEVFFLLFVCSTFFKSSPISRFIRDIHKEYPWMEVIVLSHCINFKENFEILSSGAFEYLVKSPNIEEFVPTVDAACKIAKEKYIKISQGKRKDRKNRLATISGKEGPGEVSKNLQEEEISDLPEFLGRSTEVAFMLNMVNKVAPYDCPVLITGETGVGKELIASLIHKKSARRNSPFIAVNCGAIPDTLLENELFGHEKGAYTDAITLKGGLLEEADGGTLFLDEVSELSLASQVKLLRVLETCKFRRLGGGRELEVKVRFVAATNKSLREEINAKRFHLDFFYRIAVIAINIPPLRERREDIPLLMDHYLKKFNLSQRTLSPTARRLLCEYKWPGNVRELKNIVERLSILSENETITLTDLLLAMPDLNIFENFMEDMKKEGLCSLKELERKYIEYVLSLVGGNHEKASRILGITHRTIHNKFS